MFVLNPSEDFPIVRVLSDHTDANTNYVQAVITDATSDTVLVTLNLDDKGNRRFKKVWHVPYDNVSSRGRFIVITTTVYTDSGYTSKNPAYGEIGDTYLIQQRFDIRYLPAGGGVDYKEMRKHLAEEVSAIKFPAFPELPKVDEQGLIDKIVTAVEKVEAKVDAIPEPETPEPIDFSPLLSKLDAIRTAITTLPHDHADLSPILDKLTHLGVNLAYAHTQMTKHINDTLSNAKMNIAVEHSMQIADTSKDTKKKQFIKNLAAKHGIKIPSA